RRRQLHMNTSGNVKLDGASLARFDLSDIPGLRGADFSRADLRSTYFGNVEMVGLVADSAILDSATLIHANMRGASLKQALARGARLDSAILTDAHLEGADLSGANLEGAHLNKANLTGADLSRARLKGANLKGANLTDAQLCLADLRQTLFDRYTKIDT